VNSVTSSSVIKDWKAGFRNQVIMAIFSAFYFSGAWPAIQQKKMPFKAIIHHTFHFEYTDLSH